MTGENSSNSQNKNTTFTIVACGDSARNWVQRGHSIGCNDAWKFGKPTDSLLVCNRPEQFKADRLQTIIDSKPETFYSWKANWSQYFPNWKHVNLVQWYGAINPGQVYSSNTSPFIAISLAYSLGAKDIILYGVDFKNHHMYNNSSPDKKREVDAYLQLIGSLSEKGVSVWLGADGSVFDNLIPLYEA